MSLVSYAAQYSSHTQLAFFSHLESWNNSSTMNPLYRSWTCPTAIYILVFLTSPTFFLSIYHPRFCSHTRLASPIFPLTSNCHTNRRTVFYALILSLLIIIFYPLWRWFIVCVLVLFSHVHRFAEFCTLCSPKTGFDRVWNEVSEKKYKGKENRFWLSVKERKIYGSPLMTTLLSMPKLWVRRVRI